jgi:hypothetical protein
MKRPSNLFLRLRAPNHMQVEETPVDLPTQLSEVAPNYTTLPLQDFTQLLARYKRAGYEAVEHWNPAR